MFESCLEKQNEIRSLFSSCLTKEDKYNKIIELGRSARPLNPEFKDASNLVQGCQSTMYLRSYMAGGKVYFEAESDALISSGLAILLTRAYSGEAPETVLQCPPDYLNDLEISANLSPNRASGLYSIHLRMKQDALKFLMRSPS
jgi:cysteine desulfuration protein SufE